jgi:hypothetical protein
MANIKDLIQSIESGDSSFDEKLAAINAMEETLVAVRAKEQEAIDENVSLIVETIATMQRKVEAQLEVAKAIVPEKGDAGRDGQPGRDGKNGLDGRNGLDGQPGKDGQDGEDGVSVVDAKIDFDGSLVIGLSSGREINVGEVVAADLAEKIKVTMSTNSTVVVQDEGTTITSGVRSLNFTGTGVTATASGDSVTVNVTGGGGGGVTSVTGTAPVVSSGGTTPAISLAASYGDTQNPYASKTANFILAAPNGSAGAPTFRAVVAADIPTLNQNTTGTASNVTGTVAFANGGTGETTRQAAMDALAGAVTSGQYLRGNGTDVVMAAIQAGDVPTLNQNTTGTAANVTGIVAVANGGSGTATPSLVAGTNVTISGSWPNQTIDASGGGGGGSTIVISGKTAAYTVVAGDLASVINCSGATSFTVSLTAAATLGAGFNVTVWNTSTTTAMAVTIDPSGAETIDGQATLILRRGEGMQVVCDGTNWQTGDKKTMRGYAENLGTASPRPIATGNHAVAIGSGSFACTASGTASIALGQGNATGSNSLAIGGDTSVAASSTYATAIGLNSNGGGAKAVTSAGAMALGGSYASGTDSFAAAIANNTSTYGAKGANSIAIGQTANASGSNAVAIGWSSESTGTRSIAIGYFANATGNHSAVLSAYGRTNQPYGATLFGARAVSNVEGKASFGPAYLVSDGTVQGGLLVCTAQTTSATPATLTTTNSAVSTTNQVILPNNTAFAFTGTVVARQQASGGTASAAWKVEGLIRREGSTGTTTLVFSTVVAISNVPLWGLALTADTTRGGLNIEATGAAATNVQWVGTILTSETTYA